MTDEYKKALDRARKLCSTSERCIADIFKKLGDWGLMEEEISKLIDQLLDEEYIDERRYARLFAREKLKFNKWGKIKIAYALSGKNIDQQLIKEALSSIDRKEYIELVKNEIDRKREKIRGRNQFELFSKLMRFGQSRGYETDLLYNIINEPN